MFLLFRSSKPAVRNSQSSGDGSLGAGTVLQVTQSVTVDMHEALFIVILMVDQYIPILRGLFGPCATILSRCCPDSLESQGRQPLLQDERGSL